MNRSTFFAIFIAALLLGALPAGAASSPAYQAIQSLIRQNRLPDALDKTNQLIAKNPKDAQARFLKAFILSEQNKTDDAIAILSKLTEDYPELPEPWNNLAVLYASEGKYDQARHALEVAIHTNPSYATANENLGDLYARMASMAYDKALQLDKSNAKIHTKLALISEIFASKPSDCPTSDTPPAQPARPAGQKATADARPQPAAPAAASGAHNDNATASQQPANGSAVTSPSAASQVPTADAGIRTAVENWAHAWSTKDLHTYFAAYAPDFHVPGGQSRDDWEAMRSRRISHPKSISVVVHDMQISQQDDQHATASFIQDYHSDRLAESSHKTLHLVRVHHQWLIAEEVTH